MMTKTTYTATKKRRGRRGWTARLLAAALTAALLAAGFPAALADACPLTVEWDGHTFDGGAVTVTATAHLYEEGEPVVPDGEMAQYEPYLVVYELLETEEDTYQQGAEVAREFMTTPTASISLYTPGRYTVALECLGGYQASPYGAASDPQLWSSSYYGLYPENWETDSAWTDPDPSWTDPFADPRERFLDLVAGLGDLRGEALLEAVIQAYNQTPEDSLLTTLAYDIVWALQDTGEFEELKALEGGGYAPLLDYALGWGSWELSPQEMARTLVGTQALNVATLEVELAYWELEGLSGTDLAQAVAAQDAKYLTLRPGDALAGFIAAAQTELACYGADFMAYLRGLDGEKYGPLLDYLSPKVQAEVDKQEGETAEFPDVAETDWFAEYAYYAKDSGLFSGKDGGRFAPGDQLTVAEALTLAARLYSTQTNTPIPSGTGAWYQPYVDYLKAQGLPWQYADYGAVIDRTEFAHIFASVVNGIDQAWGGNYLTDMLSLRNQVPDGAIPDLPMGAPYAEEIYQLYRLGILTGSDAAHSFRGSSDITRAEVATILCRMLGMGLQEITMA